MSLQAMLGREIVIKPPSLMIESVSQAGASILGAV